MITAVDTNVLLEVLGGDPQFGPLSREALNRCIDEGSLVLSDVVWAETAAAFTDAAAAESADPGPGFYRRYFAGLTILDPTG